MLIKKTHFSYQNSTPINNFTKLIKSRLIDFLRSLFINVGGIMFLISDILDEQIKMLFVHVCCCLEKMG